MLFYLVAFKILFTQRLIGRRVYPTNAAPDFESQKLIFFRRVFQKKFLNFLEEKKWWNLFII